MVTDERTAERGASSFILRILQETVHYLDEQIKEGEMVTTCSTQARVGDVEVGLDSAGSGEGPMADSYEHGDELL
jgi:hypothetical protein